MCCYRECLPFLYTSVGSYLLLFFSFLWFDAFISDLSGDPKQSRQNLHMYSREIMLMKKKQQEKRTLSWHSIPLSPRLKTHSFVKYLTHLCLSLELGDLQYFISTCVGEMPPTDTGTDNLAQPDLYVHTNAEAMVSWCLYRQFCLSVINASLQTCSLEWDRNLITRTKPIYVSLWRRTYATKTMLCHRRKMVTQPEAPKSLTVDCMKGHNYRFEPLEHLHIRLAG